ncbi:MAG: hypothetical protein MRY79_05820 [Alphaproteobacteria bacterium]|nr:hypothetical protein [Alphaproteobacteria bacterium]
MKMKSLFALPLYTLLGLAVIFCASFLGSVTSAHAVKIIPPRLVISPDTKIEHMFIKNNSNKKETYRLSWKHIGMNKEGKIINLDKFGFDKAPGYKGVDNIIRFSPRRVTLEPGQTQRVTFMLRRPPNLEAGEYRSHFFVQREPQTPPAATSETQSNTGNSTVQFDVLVSRAVPIYVLHGETNAEFTLLDAQLEKNPNRKEKHSPKHFVHFDVQKAGNRSVIAVADIFCAAQGKDLKINKASKSFAIYAEGEFRKEKMAVEVPAGGCPSMTVRIKGHPNDVLANQILGEMAVKQ